MVKLTEPELRLKNRIESLFGGVRARPDAGVAFEFEEFLTPACASEDVAAEALIALIEGRFPNRKGEVYWRVFPELGSFGTDGGTVWKAYARFALVEREAPPWDESGAAEAVGSTLGHGRE